MAQDIAGLEPWEVPPDESYWQALLKEGECGAGHGQKYAFDEMLPQEAAGIIIDELASDRYLMNFSVIENAPASIDGHAGFKLLFTYTDKKGSAFKTQYYGFINGDSFYNLRYCAAMEPYFEKDISAFEQIVNSFRLVNDKAI